MKISKVGKIPPKALARPGHHTTDWQALAEALRKSPGESVLVEEFTQTPRAESIYNSLRRRNLPLPIRALGGEITTNIRNSTSTRHPRSMTGDVWVTWQPHKED